MQLDTITHYQCQSSDRQTCSLHKILEETSEMVNTMSQTQRTMCHEPCPMIDPIDVMALSVRAQRSTMNIVKPRPEVTLERNAEVFRMAHVRNPQYWLTANEIASNSIKELGLQ